MKLSNYQEIPETDEEAATAREIQKDVKSEDIGQLQKLEEQMQEAIQVLIILNIIKIQNKMEEKKRLDSVEEWRKQVELLRQALDEHQMMTQKMRAEHEEDKIEWNKQHQEHLLSVEVSFYN